MNIIDMIVIEEYCLRNPRADTDVMNGGGAILFDKVT